MLKKRSLIKGAVLAGLIVLAGLPAPATAAPNAVVAPSNHGRLVSAEPLPAALSLPGAARALRVRYTSTGFDGRPTTVSGAVFVPAGKAPRHGWPVISWAHGTVGVADACAPSSVPRTARDTAYLGGWLAAGYAVVSTDYEGLGTPGPHPYLNGRSEAFGTIDIVRAARQADRTLGRRWLAVGQSQGGQAVLFAGPIARWYAPELDLRGTIATAPPSRYPALVDAQYPFEPDRPASAFMVLAFAGVQAAHPRAIDPSELFTPYGRELFAAGQRDTCLTALAVGMAGRTVGEVFDVDRGELGGILRLLDADAEIPIVRHRAPVYVAQGTADTVVHPSSTAITVNRLRKAGSDVTFRTYPGADHSGVLAAAFDDLRAWADQRI